jgi:hypothetical protein
MRKLPRTRKQNVKKVKIMRTKTILLSTLLGALGSVAVHAQSNNVYSLNAVGYINETIYPGYNLISCPLITSPDQTLNTILPNNTNTTGPYDGDTVYFFSAVNGYTSTSGRAPNTGGTGWSGGASTNIIPPGTGFWLYSGNSNITTVTLVGTVPSGPQTNFIQLGYNLISSIVPMSGDLYSNSIAGSNSTPVAGVGFTNVNDGDSLYVFDPSAQSYTFSYKTENPVIAKNGTSPWATSTGGDPVIPNYGEAFFYYSGTSPINWVEDYSVSQ